MRWPSGLADKRISVKPDGNLQRGSDPRTALPRKRVERGKGPVVGGCYAGTYMHAM